MPPRPPPIICPSCRKGKEFVFIKDYQRQNNKFFLYFCRACQVQFWEPRNHPGSQWYQSNNPYKITEILKPKIFRGYHKKFLEKAKVLPLSSKILDLGCGTGEFIHELKKMGFDVWGVDFDTRAIKIAKERFGLEKVFSESFNDFLAREDLPKFNMITFFEVLEHLDNPLDFLNKVRKMLAPGGKIVLSTPSRERILVNANKWDFPPHHFTRWNRESIENIMSQAGFTINSIGYVESFKIILGALDGYLRSGLVQKTITDNSKKKLFLPKTLYFLGKLKQWTIAGLPAIFLWLFGKMLKRNNGIIYAELVVKQ